MNLLYGEVGYSDEEDGCGCRFFDKFELFLFIFDLVYVLV